MRTILLFVLLSLSWCHPINHVVLTILENRSFNNLLGWATRYNPDIDGLHGDESQPFNASDPDSPRHFVHDHQRYRIPVDPGHGVSSTGEQIYNTWPLPEPLPEVAPMEGFLQHYVSINGEPDDVMGAFSEELLPVTHALAREFAVFDRWFCSVPGPTQPNRMFAHSATSDGMSSNDTPRLVRGLPQKPIYASMTEAGFTWGDYFQEVPSIMLLQWPRRPPNWSYGHFEKFKRDAADGLLPTISFVEPRYFDFMDAPQNDNHPGGADVRNGEQFIKELYEAVRNGAKWNETALIITYDEHGGFYDHVPVPKDVPNPDGKVAPNFDFTRLGPRVPTIIVSPWVGKGVAIHGPTGEQKPFPDSEYEHSSISATLKKMFNLPQFLTARDAWAGTFEQVFNETTARTDCPTELPDAPLLSPLQSDLDGPVEDLQKEFVLMAGSLNGLYETGEGMTELEASLFVRQQVDEFLGECLHEGKDAHKGLAIAGRHARSGVDGVKQHRISHPEA